MQEYQSVHIQANITLHFNSSETQLELSQMAADTLQAADDRNLLTGEELAEKSGYDFNSGYRQMLATLVQVGLLGNRRPGYYRTKRTRAKDSQPPSD